MPLEHFIRPIEHFINPDLTPKYDLFRKLFVRPEKCSLTILVLGTVYLHMT